MVKYIFTFFRRLKFNVKYLYSTSLQVPINLEAYTYRNPKYFLKILDYLDQSEIDEENLIQVTNRGEVIFGFPACKAQVSSANTEPPFPSR